jgi:uncharacterized membrane protein YidH (DUF202 family)
LTSRPPVEVWDDGLQNERTALAWSRSVLSCLGCGALLARLFADRYPAAAAVLLAGELVLAASLSYLWRRRYHSAAKALHAGHHLPDGVLVALVSATVAATGVAASVGILITK